MDDPQVPPSRLAEQIRSRSQQLQEAFLSDRGDALTNLLTDENWVEAPAQATWYDYGPERYLFVVTKAQIEAAPEWDPVREPHPPLSPAAALEKARDFMATVPVREDCFWEFERLALEPCGVKRWAWCATYTLAPRFGGSGSWPGMGCWILMDGTVIQPRIEDNPDSHYSALPARNTRGRGKHGACRWGVRGSDRL